MTSLPTNPTKEAERRDLLWWVAAAVLGLLVTLAAVRGGVRLGTAGAPFLGRYRWHATPLSLLAPAVATAVLYAVRPRRLDRVAWRAVPWLGYAAAFAWTVALALANGVAGLSRSMDDPQGYLPDVDRVGDHPLRYLRQFTATAADASPATRGHPPGTVLFLWALQRLGITGHLALGMLVTALGVLTVPLVLTAVRAVCGEPAARRYLPILALAPYAVWVADSMDALVATLGAVMTLLGIQASQPRRRGAAAAAWAFAAGLALGASALFSYSVAWLGLSIACLYFARRRPFLNIATGLGALTPVVVADALGFGWLRGLKVAEADFASRIEPVRPVLWWSVISVVALLLATGPALVASARKVRNTPGWPFLVGAAAAVVFSVLAGLARGGVEHAWLPFFPWLTVAAVAPARPAGPPIPVPTLLVGAGAVTAILIAAVLLTAG